MSAPGDFSWGYTPMRHHDESYDIDMRAAKKGVVFVSDHDTHKVAASHRGDVVGAMYWPPASQSQIEGAAARPTGGWGFAWPARVVPGKAQPGPAPGAGGRTISRADAASRDAGPSLAVRPLAGAGWVDQSFAAQSVPSQALASVADRDDFTRPGVVGDPATKPGSRPGVADGDLGATPKTPGSAGASIGSQRTIPATENGSGWGGSWVPPQGWPVIAMAGTEAYAHHEVLMPAANGVVLASEFTYSGGADGDRVPVTASPAWGARPDGRVEYVGTLSSLMTPWYRSVALDMRTKRNHTTGELETARMVGWPEARRSNTYYRSADLGETFSVGRGQGIGSDDHAGQVHVKTSAPFIDPGQPFPFDGPLRFELQRSPSAIEGTIPHATHLQFSESDRSWAWHSAVNVYTDDPPDEPGDPDEPTDPGTPGDPNGPPDSPPGGDDGRPGGGMGKRPRTPGDDGGPPGLLPGGSATPGTDTLPPQGVGGGDDPFDPIFPPPERDRIPRLGPSGFTPGVPPVVLHNAIVQRQYAQRTAGSPHEWHAPGFVIRARPMGWEERRTSVIPGDGYLEREKLREFQRSPAVGMFWGWCQESGGAFVTDELEGDRFRECTVGSGGGMVFGPPEINPRDIACGGEGLPAGRRVRERTLLALADYAYFGTGTPCHKTGRVVDGWRWGQDSSGDLVFRSLSSTGVATTRMTLSGGVVHAARVADADGDTYFATDDDPATDADLADIVAGGTLVSRYGSQGGSAGAAWFNIVRLTDDMADTGQSIAMSGSDAFISFNDDGELRWNSGSDPTASGDLRLLRAGAGILSIGDSSGDAIQLDASGATADRAQVLPDRAGTFAHVDHVASAVTLAAPTSGNSHTGDTSETTIHTTTLAAARLVAGTEIAFRGVIRRTGTAGDIAVKVKLDGVTIHETTISSGGPLGATFEGWAQIETAGAGGTFSAPLFYLTEDGTVNGDIQLAQSIDTTGSVDLVVTGQLANGADTVELATISVKVTSGAE